MPRAVTENVFHYKDGRFWIAPESREVPTYDEEVAARTDELRREHPDGNYPAPHLEHDSGECVECDALRFLSDN